MANLGLAGSPPASYESDSLWSYEIGSKSRLLDNRLSLNVSAFHIDWKNIQQDVVPALIGLRLRDQRRPRQDHGLELEARMRVTDALTLSTGGSLTHAVFAQDVSALGFRDDGSPNARDGDPIQGVPRYSARVGFEYRFSAMNVAPPSCAAAASGPARATAPRSARRATTCARRISPPMPVLVCSWTAGNSLCSSKNLTNNRIVIQQPSIQGVRPRRITCARARSVLRRPDALNPTRSDPGERIYSPAGSSKK